MQRRRGRMGKRRNEERRRQKAEGVEKGERRREDRRANPQSEFRTPQWTQGVPSCLDAETTEPAAVQPMAMEAESAVAESASAAPWQKLAVPPL